MQARSSETVRVEFVLRRTAASPPPADAPRAQQAVQRGRLPGVTRVLAQAIQYEDMLRRGVGTDFADLARLACFSRERMSQLVRLLWLAPDIQREVLSLPKTPSGHFPVGEPDLRRIASKMLWSEQRKLWKQLTAKQ